MSEARKRILSMLAEGRITVEQSEELLKALEEDKKNQKQEEEQAQGQGPRKGPTFADMGTMAEQFQSQFRSAFKNVEPHTKEIKSKLKELGGWIHEAVNGMMKDFAFNQNGPIDGLDVEFSVPIPPDFANCKVCDLNNLYGSVTIKEGPEFQLKVKGKISKAALSGTPPLDWFLENLFGLRNETLRVGFDRAAGFKALFNIELVLPSSVKLRLRSVSAPVKVKGPFEIESITTISGDISVVEGNLTSTTIETVSGNLEIEEGTITLDAKTTSGDLTVRNGKINHIRAQTVSGEIKIERPEIHEKSVFELSSTSGDIQVKKPNGPIGRVEANTRTGELQSEWGSPSRETSNHGIIIDSNVSGANFKVESVSGDISLG